MLNNSNLSFETSRQLTLLFIWSKGAKTRKRILKICSQLQNENKAVYISKISEIYNKSLTDKGNHVTPTSIRKHIKLLKENKILQALNEGGRPEYLELTQEGLKILKMID